MRLKDVHAELGTPSAKEGLRTLHSDVVNAAGRIIKRKGYTNWALGLAVNAIVKSIMRNERHVFPLSVPAKGMYGIEQDVHLSLPAVLGADGVHELVRIPLSDDESAKLRESARVLAEVQDAIVYDKCEGNIIARSRQSTSHADQSDEKSQSVP